MTKSAQKKAVQYTRMCKFWRSNECKMGADCTFAHATTELRPSPKPCFEFTRTGFCTRGAECRFVHTAKKAEKSTPLDVPVLVTSPEREATLPPCPHDDFLAHMGLQSTPVIPSLEHLTATFRPPPGLSPVPSTSLYSPRLALPKSLDLPNSRPSRRPSLQSEVSWVLDPSFRISKSKLSHLEDLEDSSPDDATVATQSTASTFCMSTSSTSFWL